MGEKTWIEEQMESDPKFRSYLEYWDKSDKNLRRYLKRGQIHYIHGLDGIVGVGKSRREALSDYQWKHNKFWRANQ
jgi:hypothetical protein